MEPLGAQSPGDAAQSNSNMKNWENNGAQKCLLHAHSTTVPMYVVGISYELLRAPPPFLKKEVCHRRRACVVEI